MSTVISVVVPLYNEELVISEMYRRLKEVLDKCASDRYEIILIDDGSHDGTLNLAKDLCDQDANVKLLSFSRNFGHQIAITAGMDRAIGDAIVIIDADLQDPPDVIPEMMEKWRNGYQVVYGIRLSRKGESWFKRFTAAAFYRILKKVTSIEIPVDTGDFRLIDKKVLREFNQMREQARFVRGMVSWVGYRQGEIYYSRNERWAGETKYPFRKMLKFAIDGMLSFSHIPLKLSSAFGLLSAIFSFFMIAYGLIIKYFFPAHAIPGWASLFSAILFIGGVQLFCLGVIGEYIGRMYEELKKRPLYIINEEINFK
ncbi:glycosyltransferase family 2 protein [Desulfosediminicola ganghwensis]|uniref:glycosyltransferase family 2 protein n=1 Tax=Desulfosediminicola ganghwensis TaxID=2569540 RepID=UPI00159331A7|nr:glycosyltransferase family 2 protein [Desulfosediminicola ganghwensis]